MTPPRCICATLLTATFALAPPAAAANPPRVLAPPGNSAISQYLEVVPTGTGASAPRPPGTSGGILTTHQRSQLDRYGAPGQALAALVDATAPPPVSVSSAARARFRSAVDAARTPIGASMLAPRASGSSPLDGRSAASPVSLILDAALGGGGGGLGFVLPAFILATAVGVGAGLIRRRAARA